MQDACAAIGDRPCEFEVTIPESGGKRTMSVLASEEIPSEVACTKVPAVMQTIIKSVVSKCWLNMRKEIGLGLCEEC